MHMKSGLLAEELFTVSRRWLILERVRKTPDAQAPEYKRQKQDQYIC